MYDQYREVWNDLTGSGGDFEIDTIEVRGNPMRIYKNAPPTVRDVWAATAAFAERDYLIYEDERLTYADAHQRVNAIGAWLIEHGVQPGDRVAIAMRNYPEWLQAYWAVLAVGATVVGMNAWWTGPEMIYGLEDATPRVLIADAERIDRLTEHPNVLDGIELVAVRHDTAGATPWQEVVDTRGEVGQVEIDPDADACIFYTSGTTGRPKGAQLTHRGCVHNLWSMMFAGSVLRELGIRQGAVDPEAEPPVSAALVTTPLFHVTANNCVAYSTTLGGGKLVHMYRWDPGVALKLIEQERITAMTGVPVMAREIITHPDFENTDTSSLQTLGGGGAQLQPDLVGKIDTTVETARPNTGYGMTETCGVITSIAGDFFVDKPDSCGPALPCYEARIVDPEGNEVSPGQTGELQVRGAQIIKGYLNRPDATADTISDGWLATGDVARADEDGFLYIVDRIKDMVLRGGENIYCAEVENTLHEHPAVAECSVFGIPDDRLGEEVGAAVYLSEGASVTADELREHCRSLVAAHKVPRYIWFTPDPLPRNASGKFLRRELKDALKVEDAA